MKIRYGLVLAMAIGLGFTGCASGGSGGSGGGGGTTLADITARAGGDAGENPRETPNTEAAQDALEAAEEAGSDAEARSHFQTALTAGEAAIAEDATNPLAYRVAALAAMGLEDYQTAGGYFDQAIELRPLYEFDLVEVREQAWLDLYQQATPHVQSGDYEAAAEYFEDAAAIYDRRPEAVITLGQIYAQMREHELALENLDAAIAFSDSEVMTEVDSATAAQWQEQIDELPLLRAQVLADAGRFEEAATVYRELAAADPNNVDLQRGLATILMEMGNEEEAFTIFEGLLDAPGLTPNDYFSIGVGFYQGNDYERAVMAFSAGAEASVNDRDALEMWARSLQIDSSYAAVPPVAERWIELDPNSQNAYLILAQASNQLEDQATTQSAIQTLEALEVTVNDLQLTRFGRGGASVTGSVINQSLDAGSTVDLRFTFYAADGTPLGTVTESVSVGQQDMSEVFQVEFDSTEQVGGYGYQLTVG